MSCNTSGQPDPLFRYLSSRCTSRRLEPTRLAAEQLRGLEEIADCFPRVRLDWVTDDGTLKELGWLAGQGNRIRFEYQPFHREFYDNLRFGSDQVNGTRDGLDVASLQLPPLVPTLMGFLNHWPRMKLANAFGFSRQVARQAAAEVRSSGAVGILSVESATSQHFLDGGRTLQRIWLQAEALQLGFHPFAAPAVFLAYARKNPSVLLPKHQKMIAEMRKRFSREFPQLADRTVQMMFRLGQGNRPPVRSLRRNVEDVFQLVIENAVSRQQIIDCYESVKQDDYFL